MKTTSCLLALLLAGCAPGSPNDPGSDPDADPGGTPDPLTFDCVDPPLDGVSDDVCYAADLAYGDDSDKQALDVFLVGPDAPLVVFIHGGGFVGGDKSSGWGDRRAQLLLDLLDAGVSYATINYRLLLEGDEDGVLKPLGDSRRALQWLRYHAASFDIDPDRVVLTGGSAGAGTSLWLATHDEMADPDAEDPVERMSTRVDGISITGSQSTYDVLRWETDVFGPVFPAFTFDPVLDDPEMAARVAGFYGLESVTTLEDLEQPDVAAYRDEVDMLAWMTADDPPIRILNGQTDASIPMDTGSLYHHGLHAAVVGEYAEAAGIEVYAFAPALDLEPADPVEEVDFVLDRLGL